MTRLRLLVALALLALALGTIDTAAAAPGGPNRPDQKPQKARITWSTPRVEQTLGPGQTATVEVTLTSSADLTGVTLSAPGGLTNGKILAIEPASFASLQAGVPATVRLTFTVPAEGARCQGGVVKVSAGKRTLPASLKVRLTVPGAADCAP